jgi:integrase
MSFRKAAEQYIAAHCGTWRNPKHRAQWSSTLESYVYPIIGNRPAHLIEETEVLSVLRPIWSAKPETASRIRGRIEVILEQPEVRKLRKGENPARWRGNLDTALPAPRKVRQVRHHAAMPFDDVPQFMVALQTEVGIAASALELTILCASRTNEIISASWSEFDLEKCVWTIPASRMKSGKEHRVSLSTAAMRVLERLCLQRAASDEFVFAGRRRSQPMSNMAMAKVMERLEQDAFTVHGFRSSFRDWAAERTDYPREVVEMALAHSITNEVEAAYRRGDLFEKRKRLMDSWSQFLLAAPDSQRVVPLRSQA